MSETVLSTKDRMAWVIATNSTLIRCCKSSRDSKQYVPCAREFSRSTTEYVINPSWLSQVKTIVDYCIKDSLFVIINSHWDGGWLEESITAARQTEVNKRQAAYWKQIAATFRDYGRHLLFASANEPAVQDPYGTAFGEDRMAILNSYHQTFIDAVRATGGNNASRTLIVQGPRADIELTHKIMTTMPKDNIAERLMAEVHFYPYQFTLMENDESWGKVFYYWGKNNHSTTDTERNPTWGEESFVDSVFNLMKKQFVDKNIPVILGEFGAVKRTTLTGEVLKRHLASRCAFYNYVVSSALSKGIIPAAWDAGGKGNLTMTIFDRKTGAVYDQDLLNAIRSAGLSNVQEWKAATINQINNSAMLSSNPFRANTFMTSAANGKLIVSFPGIAAGAAYVTVKSLLGKTLLSRSINGSTGHTWITIPIEYRGLMILQIQQGSRCFTGKVINR